MSAGPIKAATTLAIGIAVTLTGATLASAGGVATAEQAEKEKSQRVCRTVTPSGSRLTRRICRSQADWDSTQQKTQDGVLDQQLKQSTLLEQAPRPR
jgi:hypothetical protein